MSPKHHSIQPDPVQPEPQTQMQQTQVSAQRKVFVRTYGCQMNVYDSERMSDSLAQQGYETTHDPEQADLVLLNTCHIREKAAEKVYSEIGRLNKIKQSRKAQGQDFTIGVTGCVAQAEGEEMIARAPAIDLVVGPQSYHRLPDLLADATKGTKVVDTDFAVEDKFEHLPAPNKKRVLNQGVSAFLTVQEGCDKFCTFCVVPYTRGAEQSRPVSQIIDEAKQLVDAGVREITLLGQNVNAWHGEGPDGREWGLGRLLHALAKLPHIKRLRYTTSHPRDMDDELIAAHGELDCLMPYLHLPVQAGSDRILKAMNRHHTRDDYLRLIERIRCARPDIALSGDFIVGFPGESDEEFAQTLSLVEEVEYASAFSFIYSQRPGTPGAGLEQQIEKKLGSQRLQTLQTLLNAQQLKFNQQKAGTKMEVLVEKRGRHPGQMIARSPWLQSVVIEPCDIKPGAMVEVEILEGSPNSLRARLL